MMRSNSRAAVAAIRAHVEREVSTLFEDGRGQSVLPFRDAWGARQVMLHEVGDAVAHHGEARGFREWVQGLSFGDLANAGDHVAEWLQQGPDEAGRYDVARQEQTYLGLLAREFVIMAGECAPDGPHVSIQPRLDPNSSLIKYLVTVWDGDVQVDNALMAPRDAVRAQEWAHWVVGQTGRLPHAFEDGRGTLETFARWCLPIVREWDAAMDGYRSGRIGDEGYYGFTDRVQAQLSSMLDATGADAPPFWACEPYGAIDEATAGRWEWLGSIYAKPREAQVIPGTAVPDPEATATRGESLGWREDAQQACHDKGEPMVSLDSGQER